MTWLQTTLHAHPQLFGYVLLAVMLGFVVSLAAVTVADQLRAERWADWHRNQRPRRF